MNTALVVLFAAPLLIVVAWVDGIVRYSNTSSHWSSIQPVTWWWWLF